MTYSSTLLKPETLKKINDQHKFVKDTERNLKTQGLLKTTKQKKDFKEQAEKFLYYSPANEPLKPEERKQKFLDYIKSITKKGEQIFCSSCKKEIKGNELYFLFLDDELNCQACYYKN